MAGIPLKNTLRDFGRMWRQSPLDMTEDERLHLWDAAFAVAWRCACCKLEIFTTLRVNLPPSIERRGIVWCSMVQYQNASEKCLLTKGLACHNTFTG